MRTMRNRMFTLALLPAVAFFGCGGNDDGRGVVAKTAEALGGSKALRAVQALRVTASGQRFEPEQTFRPGDPPLAVSTFQYTLTHDAASGAFRYDWQRGIVYPFVASLAYAEVVAGDQGYVDGQDAAGGQPARAGMSAARVATLRKLNRLTSPLLLVRQALDDPGAVETRPDEVFDGKRCHVIAVPGEASPIRLFIDPDTFLPAKADTLEDDPYDGDTLYEVTYGDWRPAGNVLVPLRLTHRVERLGRVVTLATEDRSQVQENVQPAPGTFDVPAELVRAPDPADARRGERMSQWFVRRQALGLLGYADQSLPVVFTESSAGSGVWHVTGITHNSLVVEMADHLVVVEPPLCESRSQAVIAVTKARFPGKPIRYVVVTHFHFDHAGGVRTYAAEGATVIVGAASQSHFQAVLAAPHTLVPDALQESPRQVAVTPVPAAGLTLTDGARTVAVYPVENTHAADMVIVYVPGPNLVFVSDLLSPTGPVVRSSLPGVLQTAFADFGLTVDTIAGGHGAMVPVQ